jgi:hypothetical protein
VKRILTAFVLALYLASAVSAQDSELDKARQNGTNLPVHINGNVEPNVTAQAVLIPRVDARRIFGKEIADNYAVIEVNVGNKSGDAALIIHGIFIDYKNWALSGSSGPSTAAALGDPARATAEPFQASTIPSQVASEEYRVVRGQLLDAQMWSKRNWTMRILTFAGNLAGAYAFSINEEGIVKGLNAFSGVVVPGIREVWPDGTIEQLNRVSDFGYQANKVIPRQGAEVIVCFFPIDRFLTPGFKKLFLKSPALFFAPLQMLVDKKLKNDADGIVKSLDSGLSVDELRQSLPCSLRATRGSLVGQAGDDNTFAAVMDRNAAATCRKEFGIDEVDDRNKKGGKILQVKDDDESRKGFKKLLVLDFISQMSLNNVSVTVDGVMTLDTTTMAARPDGLKFDSVINCGDDKSVCFWGNTAAEDGVRTGSLTGAYMTGGSVVIAEASDLGITELKTVNEGSTDQSLRFSFKLTKPVPPNTPLHFVVQKVQTGAPGTALRTINSLPREYGVGYTPERPKVTGVTQEGNKLTVTGGNFLDAPPTYPLVVKLRSPAGEELEVKRDKVQVEKDGEKMLVTIDDDLAPAGCWSVEVSVGVGGTLLAMEEGPDCDCFVVLPKPKLDKAEVQGNLILLTGEDLIDTGLCGGKGMPLNFQLIKEREEDKPRRATIRGLKVTRDGAALALPDEAKTGKWYVQVLLGLVAVDKDKGGQVELINK